MPRNFSNGEHYLGRKINPQAMNFEDNRLASYNNWRNARFAIPLAKEGLYYTGSAEEKLKCYACSFEFSDWGGSQTANDRHREIFPDCSFITGQLTDQDDRPNIPLSPRPMAIQTLEGTLYSGVQESGIQEAQADINVNPTLLQQFGVTLRGQRRAPRGLAGQTQAAPRLVDGTLWYLARPEEGAGQDRQGTCLPDYDTEDRRRQTFQNFPAINQRLQQQMVYEGFIYTGQVDLVVCVYCGLALNQWRPEDDAKYAHYHWSPGCPRLNDRLPPSFLGAAGLELKIIGANDGRRWPDDRQNGGMHFR